MRYIDVDDFIDYLTYELVDSKELFDVEEVAQLVESKAETIPLMKQKTDSALLKHYTKAQLLSMIRELEGTVHDIKFMYDKLFEKMEKGTDSESKT